MELGTPFLPPSLPLSLPMSEHLPPTKQRAVLKPAWQEGAVGVFWGVGRVPREGDRKMRGMPAGCLAGLCAAGRDEAAVQKRE